jgi:hypothetical protein
VSRLHDGIEGLSYASKLACEMRELFSDPDVVEMVERCISGATLESIFCRTEGQGKKKRYIAQVTIQWSKCALSTWGQGVTLRMAVLNALAHRQAQRVLPFPEADDLPF